MTFTKEWLQKAISDIETMRDEIPFGLDEDERNTLAALKLALASLEAEPAGFIARHKETGKFGSYLHPKADWFKNDDYEVLKAYTAPPAPVTVPAGYRLQPISEYDAMCAAMLQGAERVTTAYKLPFEQWLSQQTGTIDVECGCVMTEVFFYWLRVAYEAGNSPVIQDGWDMATTIDV